MDNKQTHTDKPAQKDAAIETGAALANGALFGLVGAVIGRKVGGWVPSACHNLAEKAGGWVGGILLATLSIYASFKNRTGRAEQLNNLQEENMALKSILFSDGNRAIPADEAANAIDGTLPDQSTASSQSAHSSQPHAVVKDITHSPALQLPAVENQR